MDRLVVEWARTEFACPCAVTIADGRTFLASTQKCWDFIFLDVCTSERLAWHLFTVEGLRTIRQRLTPNGVLAVQFIAEDGPWPASVAATIEAVFGPGVMFEAPHRLLPVGPRWIVAGKSMSRGAADFLDQPDAPWVILPWPERGILLTDDHFPMEWAWAEMAQRWRGIFGARRLR
jgi:spermidine synthase